jgi:hypothetical protein
MGALWPETLAMALMVQVEQGRPAGLLIGLHFMVFTKLTAGLFMPAFFNRAL